MKLALFLCVLAVGCHVKIYATVSDLPSGTAGSVVANRLTENPTISVLVVEDGPTNEGVVDSEAPFLVIDMMANPRWSWNYTTTPQQGFNV
ncbi:hypothetical protein B0H14DRAFT_3451134 [Mycena olivaceomarginata]|nr:hypothetical protein B0H14DRAFT_3451134 [Mycena olivaceomarginata]